LVTIIYPEKKPAIKEIARETHIFCVVRKRWLKITPEEWVRQNFILYLTEKLLYPISLIAVEKQINLHERKKRFDIAVYNNSEPYILIECKEMEVTLTQNVLMQALQYNSSLQAPMLVITNGKQCFAFEKKDKQFLEIFEIPFWEK
jgi:hypothetical protein